MNNSTAPSDHQRLAHVQWPPRELDAVGGEQSQRQAVDAESDAAGMRDLARGIAQISMPRRNGRDGN